MQLVYATDRFRVALINGGRGRLVITFDHWRKDREGFPPPTPTKLIAECGASELKVQSSRNDWYMAPETAQLIDAVGRTARGYRHVVNYGFSMGGYGALLLSAATRAREVFLISPQYAIDPAICPFETRWQEALGQMEARFIDPATIGNRNVAGLVIFDPASRLDRLHAARITQAFPGIGTVPFRFGGHPATRILQQAGTVGTMGRLLVQGADRGMIRQLHRKSRRCSSQYWLGLANAVAGRWPDLAVGAYLRALAIGNIGSREAFVAAARLCDLGEAAGLPILRRLYAQETDRPGWWLWRLRMAEGKFAGTGPERTLRSVAA